MSLYVEGMIVSVEGVKRFLDDDSFESEGRDPNFAPSLSERVKRRRGVTNYCEDEDEDSYRAPRRNADSDVDYNEPRPASPSPDGRQWELMLNFRTFLWILFVLKLNAKNGLLSR